MGAELGFEGVLEGVELGDDLFGGAAVRGEAYEDEGVAVFAEKERVAEFEVADHAGGAGGIFEGVIDGGEGGFAGGGVGSGKALDDEGDAVDEGGVEAGGELLVDLFCLAAFDAGCGFEVALRVEGEREESEDRDKDDQGYQGAAQRHGTYDVRFGGGWLRGWCSKEFVGRLGRFGMCARKNVEMSFRMV